MISILVSNLTKNWFRSPTSCAGPTKWCELKTKSEDLKRLIFTLQTKYLRNINKKIPNFF
jgi:hypothetical protein